MARKPDIQYIHQFYVYGSEAAAVDLGRGKKYRKTALPEAAPEKKILVRVDPVAICGILVAVALLATILAGVYQCYQAQQDYYAMNDYVLDLRNQNIELQMQYEQSYDLADIESKALALGMVPASQAEVITFQSNVPQREAEPTLWENISWFLSGLFA